MSRFMVSGDGFVFLINFYTSTFRSLNRGTLNKLFCTADYHNPHITYTQTEHKVAEEKHASKTNAH